MRVILGAVISLQPFSPGMAWNWLQHAAGLQRLGHEVYYVEEVQPDWCVDNQGRPTTFERSVNREVFRRTMERLHLWGRACQLYGGGRSTSGLSASELATAAAGADVLINMSGHVTAEEVLSGVRCRAYVDQDPVYTQLWASEYGQDLGFGAHDVFFSVGLNIGTTHTPIPDCGLKWHPTFPPVVLDWWPASADGRATRFTTVASWSGYHDLEFEGEWYRSKYDEFRRFASLPRLVEQEFEALLKAYREDDEGVQMLESNGWLVAPAGPIADLDGYRDYIGQSRAAIDVAKNAYVKARSGWFGDRAAHFLASAKPVLAQSTGFERVLPTGEGLLSFSDLDEAAAGIEEINRDYVAHCRAARAFAEEHLAAEKVLARLLETCQEQAR